MNITDNEVRTATRIWYQDDEYEPGPREMTEMRTVLESVHGPSSADSQTPSAAYFQRKLQEQDERIEWMHAEHKSAQEVLAMAWRERVDALQSNRDLLVKENTATAQQVAALEIQLRDALEKGAAPKQAEQAGEWSDELTEKEKSVVDAMWAKYQAAVAAPCDVPSDGWVCSRAKGHDGPCAARLAPAAPPKPIEADPEAPQSVAALPAYWDARRAREGKPDLSRCAADLRVALAAQTSDRVRDLDGMDQDCVDKALREHEPHEMAHILASMLRRRFPKPEPKPRTPSELRKIILRGWSSMDDEEAVAEALNELVRQAEASK